MKIQEDKSKETKGTERKQKKNQRSIALWILHRDAMIYFRYRRN